MLVDPGPVIQQQKKFYINIDLILIRMSDTSANKIFIEFISIVNVMCSVKLKPLLNCNVFSNITISRIELFLNQLYK